MKLFLYSFLFVFQLFIEYYVVNSSEELNGHYILQNVNCECFFEAYDISDLQLWFFPDENLMLTNSQMRGSNASIYICLLYTSPSPRDMRRSRMPSSA